MKTFLLAILVALAALTASAGNYPDRSDFLWVTVPDHSDWLYAVGENAAVEVQLYQYGVPMAGQEVEYELGMDLMRSDKKGKVILDRNGRAMVDVGTMKEPGFRDCVLKAKVDGTTTTHHVKVGFSPDKLAAYTKNPEDFDRFWDNAKAELAKVPLTYTIEAAPEYSNDKVECFLVKLKTSNGGNSIYGYLTKPRDAKPGGCPVVLNPPGAGVKTIKEPGRHLFYAEDGFIRFETEIHGLDPRMPKNYFDEVSKAFGGRNNGYLVSGVDNRDNYYMKNVYLSLVRAIDFLTSLPEWDGKNVIMQGGSQGGALAIVGAALDPRVTACVAHHPALSEMARYKSGKTGGYPHLKNMLNDANVETLQYYDVVNFAKRLKSPTLMTWGYNDNTCPPTTSYIVYNSITAPKEALITPINEHWVSSRTERKLLEWMKNHLSH